MIVVDTNVLVYAVNNRSPHHARTLRWLDNRRRSPDAWYVTWPIVYEFLRVVTHANVFKNPWRLDEAWNFVEVILASPGLDVLTPTSRHAQVAPGVFTEVPELQGNLMHDTHTAVLMREHGISRICTLDADFHRFPFIEVVNPLRD